MTIVQLLRRFSPFTSLRNPRKAGDVLKPPRVRLSLQSLEDRLALNASTATLATIGLPNTPSTLFNVWAEKNYQWHSTLTTYTFGNVTYKVGAVEEATYTGSGPTRGEGSSVTGSGWSEYTFEKIVDGLSVTQSDPSKNYWSWDSTMGDAPPAALGAGSIGQGGMAATTPPPPPPGPGSGSGYGSGSGSSSSSGYGSGEGSSSGSTGTPVITPGVVSGGGTVPFVVPSLAEGQFWSKVVTTENSVRLANGISHDSGLEYAYSKENRENSTNTLTPETFVTDNTFETVSATTGDYFNQYTASDWTAHANADRQGTYTANNQASGTFSETETLTDTQNGGAPSDASASRHYVDATRLNGTYSNHSNLHSYFGKVTDDANSLLGETTRIIDNNGDVVTHNDSDLNFVRNPDNTEWKIDSGTISDFTSDNMTVENDQLHTREDFRRRTADTYLDSYLVYGATESGFNEVDSQTNYGAATAKSTRDATFANGIATVDKIKQEESFNRYESNSKGFERKYDRQSRGQDGAVSNIDGKESGKDGTDGYYNDSSETKRDFIAYTVVDTKIWGYSGTQSKVLKDKGKSISDTLAKMEYDSSSNLAGPFLFEGNIRSEVNINPAILAIVGGVGSPFTNKLNMESSSKWAGTVSSDKTNSGPQQFTTTLKKKSVYDDNADVETLKVTDLIGVNGRPTSGTIVKKTVKLGKDTIDQTTSGALSDYTNAENGQPRQLLNTHTVNTTSKWWADNTLGTAETTTTYMGGVKTVDNLQNSATNGGSSLVGTYTIDQFLPTKSDTRTEYIPNLVIPNSETNAPMAGGTFDNTRKQTDKTVDGVLVSGDFLRTSKTKTGYDVKVKNTNDLGIPNRVVGSETRISTEIHAGTTDHTFDQQVVAGVVDGEAKVDWNAIHEHFDDTFKTGWKDGKYDRITLTNTMNDDVITGDQTSIVANTVEINSKRITNVGDAGRGVNVSKKTVEVFLKETTYSSNFGGWSANGSSRVNTGNNNGTVNKHVIENYDVTQYETKLRNFYIDVNKSETSSGTSKNSSPNGVWIENVNSSTKKYKLKSLGEPAPGYCNGTLMDYYTSRGRTRDNENTNFSDFSGTTYGSLTPSEFSTWPTGSLLDASTAQAQWNIICITWANNMSPWMWNNGGDLLRIAAGVIDVAAGAVLVLASFGPWAPATATGGFALIFYGVDQAVTGSMNMRYGRVGKNMSLIETGVYAVTGNETVSVLLPAAAALGVSLLPRLAPGLFRAAGTAETALGGNSGIPLVAPTHANAHGFSIRNVNPTRNRYNCMECCIIVNDILGDVLRRGTIWTGRAAAAASETLHGDLLQQMYRTTFTEILSLTEFTNEMSRISPRSRGIIFAIAKGADEGHFFNYVNQGGQLRFLCGQIGGRIDPSQFFVFRILRTQ